MKLENINDYFGCFYHACVYVTGEYTNATYSSNKIMIPLGVVC